MLKVILGNKISYVITAIYLVTLFWFFKLRLSPENVSESYLFNWFYGLIPLIGGTYVIFFLSKKWGGLNSTIGKGLIFISFGLLSQWVGLQLWTYYNVIAKVEVPYPSLADFGYFMLIPFYAIGAYYFASATGGKYFLKTTQGKFSAIIIPLIILLIAYGFFIKDIGIDLETPVKMFFDFAYPLGEIIPFAIALFILHSSKKFLGGKMKTRIIFLTFAFCFQFFTEYFFLYAVSRDMYSNGGINDLFYATSYFIMVIALLSFGKIEE